MGKRRLLDICPKMQRIPGMVRVRTSRHRFVKPIKSTALYHLGQTFNYTNMFLQLTWITPVVDLNVHHTLFILYDVCSSGSVHVCHLQRSVLPVRPVQLLVEVRNSKRMGKNRLSVKYHSAREAQQVNRFNLLLPGISPEDSPHTLMKSDQNLRFVAIWLNFPDRVTGKSTSFILMPN